MSNSFLQDSINSYDTTKIPGTETIYMKTFGCSHSQVGRVRSAIADGVREIWLSSEDSRAYGRDLGVNLQILLNALVVELPSDGSTMLRIGMTNPPYILEHLKEIAEILSHSCVYSFLHVPAASLQAINREYAVSEFRTVVDALTEMVPRLQIAIDICGIPGTPVARKKKVPSNVVKRRSRELTGVFDSFTLHVGMEGKLEFGEDMDYRNCHRRNHLVGHTKGYIQVLVVGPESKACWGLQPAKITSVGRWSVFVEVIEILNRGSASSKSQANTNSLAQIRVKPGHVQKSQNHVLVN